MALVLDVATACSGIRLRTCIATRTQKPDVELLRVVARRGADGYVVIPDPRRRMSGRGAWLTPNVESLFFAEKKRAFHRALRVSGSLDTGPVHQYLVDISAGSEHMTRTYEGKTEH